MIGLILLSSQAVAFASGPEHVARTAAVMGTTLEVQVEATSAAAGVAAIEEAFSAVRRIDRLLSTWDHESELARVNRATVGAAVPLSVELTRLLREGLAWDRETSGAFRPTIGPLISAWDLRGSGAVPDSATLGDAIAASAPAAFALDGEAIVRRSRDGWIDSGAFGKGAALRAAWAALDSVGVRSGFLNFGGQVLAIGRGPGARPWRVPVAHPAVRDSAAVVLELSDRSASTTSQSQRFVMVGGQRFGHVLDPRSGRPVPAWGSVTVIARDAAVADILSTALFVMGPDAGLRWAEDRGDVAAIFLVGGPGGLVVRATRAASRYLASQSVLTTEES